MTESKKIQPEPDQQKKTQVSKVPVQQKGLRVIARNDDDGFYYPGMIYVTSDVSRVCIIIIINSTVTFDLCLQHSYYSNNKSNEIGDAQQSITSFRTEDTVQYSTVQYSVLMGHNMYSKCTWYVCLNL